MGLAASEKVIKWIVALLLLFALCDGSVPSFKLQNKRCDYKQPIKSRPHSVSLSEFGAVGDGKTLNTVAFQNAIFYLKSFSDKGGGQLYIPSGRWLTGSFSLTSHLTLFLERDAIILGTQNFSHWSIVDPLPSYGRGIDLPGQRYSSLITGSGVEDVIITGNHGTIDGQGSIWWEQYKSHSLKYSRPQIIEFVDSSDIVISNLTFSNAPSWNIHPVYCSGVLIENITVNAPPESSHTSGIVPDSSEHVCIGDSNITTSYDAIVLKSGWDEYGIAYGRPTVDVHMRRLRLESSSGAGLAFGSEMSGGISNVVAEHIHMQGSHIGIALKTSRGRGGYIKDIIINDVEMEDVYMAIKATGQFGTHPDDKFDPSAIPVIEGISLKNMIGTDITIAGNLSGMYESPFSSFFLSNITFNIIGDDPSTSWICSYIWGFSRNVNPEPCPELEKLTGYSFPSFSIVNSSYDRQVEDFK